jgi:hypothetical protein
MTFAQRLELLNTNSKVLKFFSELTLRVHMVNRLTPEYDTNGSERSTMLDAQDSGLRRAS